VRSHGIRRLGWFGCAALAAAVALAVAVPASGHWGHHHGGGDCGYHGKHCYRTSEPSYVDLEVPGTVVPLVNSGEEAFGTVFEGIPDGIGAVPGQKDRWHKKHARSRKHDDRYVDLYVTHEQSHVPFGGFADHEDSSVTRVRVDVEAKKITDMDVALSPSLGFIRFCSAFMAGPEHGFPHYTFLVNEESNDPLPVPAGAPYGPDPSLAPLRQAGFAAYLDTRTGKVGVLASHGRHNHENTVIVPGGWRKIVGLSGDDTFTTPSTPARPNLSQLYMTTTRNWKHFQKDESTLWAFRVTGTGGAAIDPADPFNGANDYLDMEPGDDWTGEFIRVPEEIARGTTAQAPQDALEDWSNANNVFQFVRVEDIAYDDSHPRVVYFADTGNTRLIDPGTGRLYRAPSGTPGTADTPGRIFKLVLNRKNPRIVDSFSILVEASAIGMRSPDNVDTSRKSLMVQEDASDAKVWRYSFATGTWTHVATANQPAAETSGILDVSRWFGRGWWALDVQSHTNQEEFGTFVWNGPGGPPAGSTYVSRRENGQLLLMNIPGS
jgi:hypothetical protein